MAPIELIISDNKRENLSEKNIVGQLVHQSTDRTTAATEGEKLFFISRSKFCHTR
jgi:hypothetical protein